ncbi:MAG: carbohydrate-binding family 9-like protein [Planctomycetota bacterium]
MTTKDGAPRREVPDYERGLAPPQPARTYRCRRTPRRLAIDGDLTKPEWATAPWTDLFVDIEGDLRPAPRFATRAKLLWDDERLYVGAELEEPDLWATLTERDSVIFHDNDFEVFLDPSCEGRGYYELEINALGTVWDLVLREPYRAGGQADSVWRIEGLETAVRLDGTLTDPSDRDRGWTVEIAMPFAAFDVHAEMRGERPRAPRPGERWGLDFSRVQWDLEVEDGRYRKIEGRKEHNWVWSPMGLIDMHLPLRWGSLVFE